MFRKIAFVALLVVAGIATASDTVRMDRGIVTTGMNVAEVISKAGA